MTTATRGVIGIALAVFALAVAAHSARLAASQQAAPAPLASVVSPHRAVLNRYCVTCHNERLKTAGLRLDQIDVDTVSSDEAAAVLEKVVRKLRTGSMPPPGAPRPEASAYDLLSSHLETQLDRFAAAHPNPGRTAALHRLNRNEYANAVRDLLALDIDAVDVASLLPADDSGYGFDNIGDVLAVSPVLFERYISAAARVARLAVGIAPARPDLATYEVSKFLKQDVSVSEDLPFGSRGGAAVSHYFPVDGEYVIKARLKRSYDGQRILGLGEPTPLEFRIDGVKVGVLTVEAPRRTGPEAAPEADAHLDVRVSVKAGARVIGVTFPQETRALEQDSLREFGYVGVGLRFDDIDQPALGTVSVLGPYNPGGPGDTPSRRRIFICTPSGVADRDGCAKRILTTVARRAYRRPVTDLEVEPLLKVYHAGYQAGGFDAGIEMALQRLLVSPEFLFRIERDPAVASGDGVYRISDLELASRLSFFLWSSIPDDELTTLAASGKLRDANVLAQQVRRMLADPRASALVTNFAGQWLYLRNVRSALPDIGEYPDFDENLRDAFGRETELFLDAMLREDHSVLDLLRADFTFLNERLARHYGMPGIYGSHFRRVTVRDPNRRGLLGQGSILMVTSYSNRTAPTIRGKWVLENLLGAPPPPPPPDVPALMDRNETGRILSMREQMEKHRANAACAVCHKAMDPLGFALENFDAIGRWRDTSGAENTTIDASGELPDGTKFSGPAGLRDVLLRKPELFANTVAEKLLTYALGRGLQHYDAPAVRNILRQSAPAQYRWSSLVLAIVQSEPFQMRRSRQS
jgi:hypothetical protein